MVIPMRLAEPSHVQSKIPTDLEHLRKLFIMPDSPDRFMQFGYELLDLIHSFFKEKGGIHSEISLPQLACLFNAIDIPKEPKLLKDILAEVKQKVIKHSVKVGNPYYIGHMTSAIPYFMILLEMIIAALNQNQVKIETAKASTFVEREFISWIHRLIFCKSASFYKRNIQNHRIALGNVTLDGTLANLTAMLVARNKAFPADERFPGIRKAGVAETFRYYAIHKAVFIVSQRGHYSIDKVARITGIGDNNVIKIPVDSNNKIDINALKKVLEDLQIPYELNEGDGAFYGPKIDIKINDCLGRQWQCSTIQVDFNIPEKFEIKFIDEDGKEKTPILIHRAILGSLERFFGVLIEHYKGNFPLWLAPEQLRILPITEKHNQFSETIEEKLSENFRVSVDLRNEKITKKIKDAEDEKIPYMLIVGDKEIQTGNFALRKHQKGMLGNFTLKEIEENFKNEIEKKLF